MTKQFKIVMGTVAAGVVGLGLVALLENPAADRQREAGTGAEDLTAAAARESGRQLVPEVAEEATPEPVTDQAYEHEAPATGSPAPPETASRRSAQNTVIPGQPSTGSRLAPETTTTGASAGRLGSRRDSGRAVYSF